MTPTERDVASHPAGGDTAAPAGLTGHQDGPAATVAYLVAASTVDWRRAGQVVAGILDRLGLSSLESLNAPPPANAPTDPCQVKP
jgi:hypothetical protein